MGRIDRQVAMREIKSERLPHAAASKIDAVELGGLKAVSGPFHTATGPDSCAGPARIDGDFDRPLQTVPIF